MERVKSKTNKQSEYPSIPPPDGYTWKELVIYGKGRGIKESRVIDLTKWYLAFETKGKGLERDSANVIFKYFLKGQVKPSVVDRYCSLAFNSADTDKSGCLDVKEFLNLYLGHFSNHIERAKRNGSYRLKVDSDELPNVVEVAKEVEQLASSNEENEENEGEFVGFEVSPSDEANNTSAGQYDSEDPVTSQESLYSQPDANLKDKKEEMGNNYKENEEDKQIGYDNKDKEDDRDIGYGNKEIEDDREIGYGNKDELGYDNKDKDDKDTGYGNKEIEDDREIGYGNKEIEDHEKYSFRNDGRDRDTEYDDNKERRDSEDGEGDNDKERRDGEDGDKQGDGSYSTDSTNGEKHGTGTKTGTATTPEEEEWNTLNGEQQKERVLAYIREAAYYLHLNDSSRGQEYCWLEGEKKIISLFPFMDILDRHHAQ